MVDGGVPSPGVFEPARLIVAGYNARPHSREALLWPPLTPYAKVLDC